MKKYIKDILKKIIPQKEVSSLSDNNVYPAYCMEASKNERIFLNFRRNEIYNQILEHVTEKEGAEYIIEIKKQSNRLNDLAIFKENDLYGNPIKIKYPEIGEISPTTLRYIKVLSDLENTIGELNNLNIIEIGVGYGGQCRVIQAVSKPSSYTLVDLDAALALTKTYLNKFNIANKLHYKTMEELDNVEYDLLISNYAFSELPRNIQDIYLEKVILKSKHGYITYNEINPIHFNSYKKDQLLQIISNSKITDEVPLTSEKNCIIKW